MAQTVLNFSLDPTSSTTWQANQLDLTLRLRLSSTGPAIQNILGGTLYVVVNGGAPSLPKVYDVRLAGLEGSLVPSSWVQSPLNNSQFTGNGNTVGEFDTSTLQVTFDDGGSNGTAVKMTIGENSSPTPFADITLRRTLDQVGSWSLKFYVPGTEPAPSDFVEDLGVGQNPASRTVELYTVTVTAVPEPEWMAVAGGFCVLAFGMARRRFAGAGK